MPPPPLREPASAIRDPGRLAAAAVGLWVGGAAARLAGLQGSATAIVLMVGGAGLAWGAGRIHPAARAVPTTFLFLPVTLFPVVPGGWTLLVTVALFGGGVLLDRHLALDDPRRARRLLAGALILGGALTTIAGLLGIYWLGEVRYGQDTAYQANLLWNTLHGRFLRSVVLQELIHAPPLRNDFGAHNSPLQLLLLPFFAVWASPATLLLLRNLALWLAPWLLFRGLETEAGPRAALWGSLAFAVQATILWQSVMAFYFLQMALPLLVLLFLAWHRGSFGRTVLLLVLLLGVREDLAVLAVGLAGVALVQRRRWPWAVTPFLLGLGWWVLSTRLVLPAGGAGAGGAVAATLEEAGGSATGILLGAIRDPGRFLGMLLRPENRQMFLELAGSVGWVGLASPLAVAALPFLGINALVDFAPAKEVFMHYHLLAAAPLVLGAVWLLTRRVQEPGTRAALMLGLACCLGVAAARMLPLAEQARALRPANGELRRAVADALAGETSVGAPGAYLPVLADRPRLYLSSRLWEYPGEPPEVVVWDPDVFRANPLPADRERYLAWPSAARHRYRLEAELPEGVRVYRRSPGG
jgi:uncharacterized membrane protein